MKKVTFFASLIAVLSFMLASAGPTHAHPGCQGVGLEDKDDCDGDESRVLLEEEEEGEEEEESGVFVEDDCEDDDAERAAFDHCDDDDGCDEGDGDDCEGDEDAE